MTTDQIIEPAVPNKPAFIAKTRQGSGKDARYDRIGVAFKNEDGSLFVKLSGTQIVSEFALYKADET